MMTKQARQPRAYTPTRPPTHPPDGAQQPKQPPARPGTVKQHLNGCTTTPYDASAITPTARMRFRFRRMQPHQPKAFQSKFAGVVIDL